MSETIKEQTVGFDYDVAIYDERGWAQIPLSINRTGDTSNPLVVNVKFTDTLNDTAPGSKSPLYHHAVEIHWKAGEVGRKEVPVRIKAGSVQIKPLFLEAALEIPLGQNVVLEKGTGLVPLVIHNEHTTRYQDKSAEYVPQRRPPTDSAIEIAATNLFIPPST